MFSLSLLSSALPSVDIGYRATSDDRVNENESYITNGLDEVRRIRPEEHQKKSNPDNKDKADVTTESGIKA